MLTETSSRSQFVFLKGSCLQRDGQYQVRFLLTKTHNRAVSVLNVTGLVCGQFDPLDSSPSNTLYSIGTVYVYHISWPEGGGGGEGGSSMHKACDHFDPRFLPTICALYLSWGRTGYFLLEYTVNLGQHVDLGGGKKRGRRWGGEGEGGGGGGSYSLLFPLLHTVRKIHWKSVQRLFLQRLP